MVATPPQTDTYSTALDIFDRTHPLRVDVYENLKVTIAGSGGITIGTVDQGLGGLSPWLVQVVPSGTGTNLFASNDSVPYGTETTILSHTVTTPFAISQLIAWGTYDGEFLLRQNGTIVGGGRTSAADRTLNITYTVAPIPTTAGDVILVTILEYGSGLQQFRCNLLGE